jgi:hypothetical protein
MIVFHPQKGFKPIIPIFGLLTLFLIPTGIILWSSKAAVMIWILVGVSAYGLISIAYLIAQKTTKYWIIDTELHYKSTFLKGTIDIQTIRKIEVNASNWLNGKPASSNTKGIILFFGRYDDTFVTPEHNQIFVNELLKINPAIEVVYIK